VGAAVEDFDSGGWRKRLANGRYGIVILILT
jgi:hypothetical protein